MIAVADTSPLCYLILIDAVDLLPKLFGKVPGLGRRFAGEHALPEEAEGSEVHRITCNAVHFFHLLAFLEALRLRLRAGLRQLGRESFLAFPGVHTPGYLSFGPAGLAGTGARLLKSRRQAFVAGPWGRRIGEPGAEREQPTTSNIPE